MGCSICLGSFTAGSDNAPTALLCGHIFHAACIGQWFASQPPGDAHCPQCKQAGSQAVRLFPSDPADLDTQIRHLQPSRSRTAQRLATELALPSSSPERGDVLVTRLSPRGARLPDLLDPDEEDEEDDTRGREASPCSGLGPGGRRMAAVEQQMHDAERGRATLRAQWPQESKETLLRHLVEFHLALQEYVTSAHGLRLYSLPHAGRKVCAFVPRLTPIASRDGARLSDAIRKLEDAVEETERVRSDLRKVLLMNQDGEKLFRQAEAAVAAEWAVLEAERAKVREQKRDFKRVEKEHKEWGKRLMSDAAKADKKWEDMRAQLAKERQAFAAEAEAIRRQRREAEMAIAQAQRDAEAKVQAALQAQRAAEQARDEAQRDKATTHEKNLRMAASLDRLQRKIAQWESKMASKRGEVEALQAHVERLERQPKSLLRSLPSPSPRWREKRPLGQAPMVGDSPGWDEEDSLLIGPPRKKPVLANTQEDGYDYLLSNLAGEDVGGGDVRRPTQHMPAALFARSRKPPPPRDKNKVDKGLPAQPGPLHPFLRPKEPSDDVARLMRRAVQGNATGTRHKVPANERRAT